jgi:arylsulfatase A-like enzyme
MRFRPSVFAFFLISPVIMQAQKKDSRPNIIYIMADDMGYADLSCYGQKNYQTPNIDRLAERGIKFMNAYAAAPVCTPTRTAFITGRYPARSEVGLHEPLEWSAKDSTIGLTPKLPSLGSMLKKAGYETFLVGKWHLGFAPENGPTNNGFDYFFGFKGGGLDYVSHRSPRNGPPDLYENDRPVEQEGYLTELLEEKAIALIKRKHETPFFLSMMFNAPHWPWQAPGDAKYPDTVRWTQGGSPAIYAQMVKSMDDAVGRIMKVLEEENLSQNTVVIFTSDNGGEKFSDMGIYKGHKMQLWEGGIREPALLVWPGKVSPGSVTNQVATTMDWTATILALAKASPPKNISLDGIDLMPVLAGKQKEINRTLYWRISQRTNNSALRDGKWKYLKDEKGNEYLFDLNADPSETNNLKEKEPKIFENLREKYIQWNSSLLPALPLQGGTPG